MIRMTEPRHNNTNLQIPQKYREALEILTNYRESLLQLYTLRGQNPKAHLSDAETTVKNKGEQVIRGIEHPISAQVDPDVREVIDRILPYLEDRDLQIYVNAWAKKMFKEFIFTLDINHIQNFLNSTPIDENSESQAQPSTY